MLTRAAVLAAAIHALTALNGIAQEREDPARAARCADVEAAVDSMRAALGMPGLAAAVATSDGTLCSVATGLADVESGAPVTIHTRFRIRSVAKIVTAHAVARLAAEGRLDLDAPIQTYVPGFPVKEAGVVTARRLATHTAGVRHYTLPEAVFPSTARYATVTEAVSIFAGDTLLFPPGERYLYSSYGYNLLGAAIEGVTGKPYPSAIDELLAAPLGLTSFAPDTVPPGPDRATDYEKPRVGPPRPATPDDLSNRWPSGGYLATAEDLARFAIAHLDDALVPPAMRELLWSPQRYPSGAEIEVEPGTRIGIGWRIESDAAGRPILHHGGAGRGGRAYVQVYPRHGVAVAFAGNLQVPGLGPEEANRIATRYLFSQ